MVYAASSQFAWRLRHVTFADYYILKRIFLHEIISTFSLLCLYFYYSQVCGTAMPHYCGYTV